MPLKLNSHGSALMGALIGTVILGIIVSAFTAMINNLHREGASLSQKLALLNLQQSITNGLSRQEICTCNFDPTKNTSNPTSLLFNPADAAAAITLSTLYGGCSGGAPSLPIVSPGIIPEASGMSVANITLSGFSATGAGGLFSAELAVNIDPATSVIPRNPPKTRIYLQTDGNNPARITNCQAGPDPGIGGTLIVTGGSSPPPPAPPITCRPSIDPNRPYIRDSITCRDSSFQLHPFQFGGIVGGRAVYYDPAGLIDGVNSGMLFFNPTTGAFMGANGDTIGGLGPDCMGQNLKNIADNDLNKCD